MSESMAGPRGPRNLDEIIDATFAHYFRHPGNEKPDKEQQYRERGLVFTNNFRLIFCTSTLEEILPGTPNPYDYRYLPYGAVVEKFREENPDLWERARIAGEHATAAMTAYTGPLFEGREQEAEAMLPAAEQAAWDENEVLTEAFKIIAPQLETAGIDPITICR